MGRYTVLHMQSQRIDGRWMCLKHVDPAAKGAAALGASALGAAALGVEVLGLEAGRRVGMEI